MGEGLHRHFVFCKKSSKKEAERARVEEALLAELYKTLVTLEKTEILRRAVESGFSDKALILRDPDLDAIREMPVFQEILESLR